MRNLAGRLTARTIPELSRIAEFWQTVVSGRDRHAIVGQLYREMREPRSARDVWERLEAPERALIHLLALDDARDGASRTIPEIAGALGWDVETTRDVAIALYRKGILFREGGDEELPIGQLPRVLLPRELTATFRRIQDEIDAGPLQLVPLPALLALLDVNELEEAARHWGVEVVPGLLERDDLERQVIDALGDDDRKAALLASLKGDAATVWDLLSSTAGASARLDDLMGAAGMAGEGVALAQRRRTAIGKLEERLLAWHTYGPDESRFLFIPQRVIAESPRQVERQISAPVAVGAAAVEPDGWIHPWAVPWDLLTLLRAITAAGAPSIGHFEEAPGAWLNDISGLLWNRSDEESLPAYLAFLAALGRQENVLEGGENRDAPLAVGRSWKQWRARSFANQFSHLIWWWNASAEWIEGAGRSGVAVSDAGLPQFRRKLLVLLASLEQGTWYDTDSIAQWVVSVDPDILGAGAALATAGSLDVPTGHQDWARHASAAVVRAAMLSAFAWFGLVETGVDGEGSAVLRPTDMLRTLESTDPVDDLAAPAGPPVILHDDLSVELIDPTPLRVWSLSAFAEQQELRPVATYRMTPASMRRALDAGASVSDVTRYLVAEIGTALSPQLLATLQSWPGIDRRVRIGLLAEIVPDGLDQDERLILALREAGWVVERGDEGIRVLLDPVLAPDQLESLTSLVRELGFETARKTPDPHTVDDGSGG
jgi:hypothetical protein